MTVQVSSHNQPEQSGLGGVQNTGANAPASNDTNAHHYMSGAGAITIDFLLQLLKLNTEMKNDMASLSEQTTTVQGKIIDTQAQAQVDLYSAQADELQLQSYTSIATAVTSGLQGALSIGAGGFGTRDAANTQAEAQEHVENFNEISTTTDLNTGDGESLDPEFKSPYEDGEHSTPEHQKNIQKLREQLAEGRFDTKTFGGAKLSEATVTVNGTEYNVTDAIRSATPEERTDMGKKFAENRDNAIKNTQNVSQKMSNYTSAFGSLGQAISGTVDFGSKIGQEDTKKRQGAASATSQEAQGTSQMLGGAQKTLSDARDTASGNASQVFSTIREIVAAQVRG